MIEEQANPKLVCIAGPLLDTVVMLDQPETSIGRGAGNRLCISDPVLSRQHCVIKRESDHFVVRDLGSRHGTVVNG
ncbi:MAG: FHA domain-containing protein, partial [Acidobacteria bacterium]|nr:FHA domain-containing protein [Acidobacteriota bacterium]